MTNETVKTYKFVRNTVLSIGLFLSFFIPKFDRDYRTKEMENNTKIESVHRWRTDSLSNKLLEEKYLKGYLVKK